MIVFCAKCKKYLDDEWRTTVCSHDTFAVNDGENNFTNNEQSYLSDKAPYDPSQIDTINEG